MFYAKSTWNRVTAVFPIIFVLFLISYIYTTFLFGWAMVVPTTPFVQLAIIIVTSLLFMILWSYF